ncbi:MAG: GntR family transcriptional regulator [Sphingobium sp.]|nr:GntR family transcriptional regulator [Sphingobium sp.]
MKEAGHENVAGNPAASDVPLSTRLKEMILTEKLKPGERITEAGLGALLNLSRTPIRNVLPMLAAEGFLEPVGRRGFRVKQFGEEECWEALDLRGRLEGYAAALLAQRGASPALLEALNACLADGDRIFAEWGQKSSHEREYGEMNGRFHALITDGCGSSLVQSMIERANSVPFVAPSVVVFDEVGMTKAYEYLFRAHGVHHAIVEAIREGDANRVEQLFREHARQQRFSMFSRRAQLASTREPKSRRSGGAKAAKFVAA